MDEQDFDFEISDVSMVQVNSVLRMVLEPARRLLKLMKAEELHRVGLDASFFGYGGAWRCLGLMGRLRPKWPIGTRPHAMLALSPSPDDSASATYLV